MKRKKKLNIIPFIISLLIVLASISGIAIYSYKWGTNHDRYLSHVFDNTDDRTTLEVVESDLRWISEYYSYNPGTITYRDPSTLKTYGDVPFTNTSDGALGVYFKNGVLHVEGWFDLTLYSTVLYSSDQGNEEEKGGYFISYYFVFSNINHTIVKDFNPENIGMIFVDGIGVGAVDESDEESVAKGDTALNEYFDELVNEEAVGTNAYYFYYAGESLTYRIVDEAATTKDEAVTYTYRIMPQGDKSDKTLFRDLEDITFAIYYEGDSIKQIVQGTLTDLPSVQEYLDGTWGSKGYMENYNKAPYLDFIWPKIVLHCSIALVLSCVVAWLFYLIWEPTEEEEKKVKISKPKSR